MTASSTAAKPAAKSVKLTAWCVVCKAQREIKSGENIVMKNGRKAVKGLCAVCGKVVVRIGAKV